MKRTIRHCAAAAGLAAALAPAPGWADPGPSSGAPSFPKVDVQALLGHIRVLASDEFEGRAPGSRGEELTVRYVTDQYRKIGLKPGNTDGTYVQQVPMIGITPENTRPLTFRKDGRTLGLAYRDDVVAWTRRAVESVAVEDSDVVFAGYGIEAPEYRWDDFKGLDARGKTLVVLVNDPPVPDPHDPGRLDPLTFGGRAMTYYGRWTYKYEVGARMGAAAVLIVHETEAAAYPFSVVQGRVQEGFDLVAPDRGMGRCAIEGWITVDRARDLFRMAGRDYDALKAAACSRAFRPVDLGVKASMAIANKLRRIDSRNVVARLDGADPALRGECVAVTAHWDHFGIGAPVKGDSIYNGAVDNASGVAAMLEMARCLAGAAPAPGRSVLFIAVTGEEQGLLGSTHYVNHPIVPLGKTAANVNMDAINLRGRTRDVTITGFGASDLDDVARRVAAAQGRIVRPDPKPETGGYYRSDHFPFAREGVPALAACSGLDHVGKPEGYGLRLDEDFIARFYHTPFDDVKPDWELDGAVEETEFFMRVVHEVARAERLPEWAPGNEFKAKRDAMLGRR